MSVGGSLSSQGVKDGSPVAWALFIIMGAILLVWLGSASSPLNTYPAFSNTCGAHSGVNICGLSAAFSQFNKTAILTGIMTLVVPLAFAMMAEWLWKNRSRAEIEAEVYSLRGEQATYLSTRRRTGALYKERAKALKEYNSVKRQLAEARVKETSKALRGGDIKHEKFVREKLERRIRAYEKRHQ